MALKDVKVNRTPVYEQVFNYMEEAIQTKQWLPGEKIPSEIELSDAFNVNRLTVRMAMQRLIGMGLLETRVGDGTYVKEFSFSNYVKKVSDFYLTPELMDKICEFRTAIEAASVQLAFSAATDEEIQLLSNICEKFEEKKAALLDCASEEIFEEICDIDYSFHKQICIMSHNVLFVYSFDMAEDLIRQNISTVLTQRYESWKSRADRGIIYDDLHRVTVQGFKEKDLDKCLEAYKKIIDYRIKLG